MKKLVRNFKIPAPRVLRHDVRPPRALYRTSINELCKKASVAMRVSGSKRRVVVCAVGDTHMYTDDAYYVGVGDAWAPSRTSALRVLEVLAYGFHDYVARECACGRGLFVPPKPMGRPLKGRRPMTGAERMAAMRARMGEISDKEFRCAQASVLRRYGPAFKALAEYDERR
jgi:hypothetical protein